MFALVLALIAVISKSLRTIIFRSSMATGSDDVAVLTFYNVGASLILCFFLDFSTSGPVVLFDQCLVLITGFLWVIAGFFNMRSHRHLEAAEGEIYGSLHFVLLLAAAVFFFHEAISNIALVGAGLMLSAMFCLARPNECTLNRGVLYKLISIVCVTLNFILLKDLSSRVPTSYIALSGFLIPAIIYTVYQYNRLGEVTQTAYEGGIALWMTPILSVLSYYCTLEALRIGELALTSTILQLGVIFVFLFGLIFLREFNQTRKKGVLSAVNAFGAYLVCYYR